MLFQYSITLQNQTKRMINVILSLNTFVVYVTHVNCIFFKKLDMLWIYALAVYTVWIDMACAICGTETVLIKNSFFL